MSLAETALFFPCREEVLQLDKEGFAIVFGVKHFNKYLVGHQLEILFSPRCGCSCRRGGSTLMRKLLSHINTDTQNSACRMGVSFGYSSRGATAGSRPNSMPTLWGTPSKIPYEEFGKIICVVARTGQGPRSQSESLQPVSAVSTLPCHGSYSTLGILAIPAKE